MAAQNLVHRLPAFRGRGRGRSGIRCARLRQPYPRMAAVDAGHRCLRVRRAWIQCAGVRACARADGRYWPTLHSVADNAVSSSIMLRIFMRTEPCRGATMVRNGRRRTRPSGGQAAARSAKPGVREELSGRVLSVRARHCVCDEEVGGLRRRLRWIDTAP